MGFYDSFVNYYHMPTVCEKCGGVMVFEGVGTYHCENCREIAYDDYGKVRKYLEEHPGAITSEVEKGTGVSSKTIMRMLKEEMLMVAADSRVTLFCERCRAPIRSGRFCPKCEADVHRIVEDEERKKLAHNLKGVLVQQESGNSGQRRFMQGK